MTTGDDLIGAFELHSVNDIRSALDSGLDVRAPIRGKLPIVWLTEMYTRSRAFPDCLRLMLDRGAVLEDPAVAPVLLDDADAVNASPALVTHRTTMVSAFTPLVGATMLHVAAEYGSARAARALIEMGADVNATADVDEHRLNGHTPLFHTVNSILNHAEPIMRLLLDAGANADVRLQGITWGSKPNCAYEIGVTSKIVVSHSKPLPHVMPCSRTSDFAPASSSSLRIGSA